MLCFFARAMLEMRGAKEARQQLGFCGRQRYCAALSVPMANSRSYAVVREPASRVLSPTPNQRPSTGRSPDAEPEICSETRIPPSITTTRNGR